MWCGKVPNPLRLMMVIMIKTWVSIGFKYMEKVNLLIGYMKKESSYRDGVYKIKGKYFKLSDLWCCGRFS
ncbi:MAG: hypothetical protein HY999_00270 [Nitrospinae bacterium]|nr:hypothetical protein [Nitrospinota bacterium]